MLFFRIRGVCSSRSVLGAEFKLLIQGEFRSFRSKEFKLSVGAALWREEIKRNLDGSCLILSYVEIVCSGV